MSLTEKSAKVTTIGTFDGVHIGHQKILNRVVKLAKKRGFEPVVLTLFPHPRMVLQKDDSIKLLNTIDERVTILKSYGISEVVVKEFTKEFANLSARDYVQKILINELNTKQIVIGYDHHFGKNRSANINDLRLFAEEFKFTIEEISAQDIKDVTVSSTKIRNALNNGQVALANSYLGYNYFITGKVVKGKGLGRKLDFPTANIYIKEIYKLIPADGVYVVKSSFHNRVVYGMMNIGSNPTVSGKGRSIEVNFFNFNETIYGDIFKVEFLKRLRSEQKFENINALKAQLKKDRSDAQDYIKQLNE
ncbi:bifunctional riboflavin kinase/FAD synthetase [Winogradskyella alexanderae]|uniref:bifunctional riboflavin kinase/FAD synthetase n=1 Tax=Winogradskyella alexanderae TaxID=2877123 RepID=UPI00293D2A08|nr:bifunctional riboflavin kinase/FAD synthetase [Winogradskyella alexanderae]